MIQMARISRRQLPDVLHLLIALREEIGREVIPEQVSERFHALMGRRDGGLHVLVAREGRFPVAYVAGCFGTSTITMAPVFSIQEVYVAKPYRGGATIRALAAEVAGYASAKGARGMEVRLRPTQRELIFLAEALGFEPTGREVFERAL